MSLPILYILFIVAIHRSQIYKKKISFVATSMFRVLVSTIERSFHL